MNTESLLKIRDLSVFYGENEAVKKVNMNIKKGLVTAIIGPSGCGKSTLLRVFNRMHEFNLDVTMRGKVLYKDKNIIEKRIDLVQLRKEIGMVFQKPNPFPKSIAKNVTWGPKINGYKEDLNSLIETSLKSAGLWEEVKDRLNESALSLSGGQQQRLCIARTIAMNPEIILMDEPCSALDPRATARIENLIADLKGKYTIIIVTHNMQQAARVSDETAFFNDGKLIEFGETKKIFTKPDNKETENYITGRFG